MQNKIEDNCNFLDLSS